MGRRYRFLRLVGWNAIAAFGFAFAASAVAQPNDEPPFRTTPESPRLSSGWSALASDLEKRFFSTDEWTFFHSIGSLPDDMRNVLNRAAGSDAVGPGEAMDLTDVHYHPGRVQHLYTAVTDTLGVVVWYEPGPFFSARGVLYDRRDHYACRYKFGRQRSVVVPLRSTLRDWIQMYGFGKSGCEYLGRDFFD
jgi:hypothetical protein